MKRVEIRLNKDIIINYNREFKTWKEYTIRRVGRVYCRGLFATGMHLCLIRKNIVYTSNCTEFEVASNLYDLLHKNI